MSFSSLRRATMVAAVVCAALCGVLPGGELLSVASADDCPPIGTEVDVEAVLRMGSLVQRLGTFGDDDPATNDFVASMAEIPADDNHKWFVTVVGIRGCAACEELVEKWPHDEHLRALADPTNRANSWAHFNYMRADDRLNAWRFKNIKFAAYPTILVQPPLKGRGDPTAVVYQDVYRGDSAKTVAAIADAIRKYLAKLTPRVSDKRSGDGVEPVKGWGQAPTAAGAEDWLLRRPFVNPRPATPAAPPFDNPATPPATPEVSPPVVTPISPLDGLQIPPAVVPPPTPSPSTPAAPASPSSVEDLPEAWLITDAQADQSTTEDGRLHVLVEQLKARLGGKIRTRPIDWEDAKEKFGMLRRDELPAVVLTDKGRVVDKITNRMFPIVKQETGVFSLLSDFPWQALVSIFTSGPSWAAIALLLAWVYAKFLRPRIEPAASAPPTQEPSLDVVAPIASTITPQAPGEAPAVNNRRRQVVRRRGGSATPAAAP